jgi:hypothetical protein
MNVVALINEDGIAAHVFRGVSRVSKGKRRITVNDVKGAQFVSDLSLEIKVLSPLSKIREGDTYDAATDPEDPGGIPVIYNRSIERVDIDEVIELREKAARLEGENRVLNGAVGELTNLVLGGTLNPFGSTIDLSQDKGGLK